MNPSLKNNNDNFHRQIFKEFTSTVWELQLSEGLEWFKAQAGMLDYK